VGLWLLLVCEALRAAVISSLQCYTRVMNKPRGIHYVNDESLIWRRKKQGDKFVFLSRSGKPLQDAYQERVGKLIIPPAWKQVRICADKNGHIQATGLDDKGRKQYIYHPKWVAYNQRAKFNSLQRFGEILPILRETLAGHMRQRTLSRERILATVVWLLEHTFIRVGNKAYADENQSYGLTTMRTKHVDVVGNTISFSFMGKSNVYHELDISHPRVAATIKECIELPGYEIFKYLDDDGDRKTIDSADVNAYLKEITGQSLSAKDFRTWGGTTLAGDTLYKLAKSGQDLSIEDALTSAVTEVSEHLGNTVAVCRKYYIHPKIITSHERSKLVPHFDFIYKSAQQVPSGLTTEEYATLSLL
jgi:DNA topoisomerase I